MKNEMVDFFSTERLHLTPLNGEDRDFIRELVNSPGWLTYIGDRNVHSVEDAENYLQRIIQNANVVYWVVKLAADGSRIGIITYIKREYLKHPDIGFAFLPEFEKKGYAYEAAKKILDKVMAQTNAPVLATTKPENENSIRLLEKLGLSYDHELNIENEALLVFTTKVAKTT